MVEATPVWIRDGSVRLFARECGEGPALVFLHGGLASHEAVLPLVASLADTYRVVTPDLRASGRSWSSEPLSFDRLSEDLLRLLDHLSVDAAIVGGISSGSGPAVHFALHHPDRTRGLIVVTPVYAGDQAGYTEEQASAFAAMDARAGRAISEGIAVLRPMYFSRLPEAVAERAWQIASQFDPPSLVATSRFIASGTQPFRSIEQLRAIAVPTLLLTGDDPMHPAIVSDAYAAAIADCTVLSAAGTDTGAAIRDFCDAVTAA